MKTVAVLLFVALCFVGALSSIGHVSVGPTDITSVDTLCGLVGESSGCSGCVLGTKNLCRWVAQSSEPTGKRYVEEGQNVDYSDRVDYYCLSRETTEVNVVKGLVDDVSFLCPANPAKEPIIKGKLLRSDGLTTLPQSSTINTTYFTDDMANFATVPHAVDRTSFWEQAGAAYSTKYDSGSSYDCATLLSPERTFEQCGNFIRGAIYDERDKFCTRQLLAAGIASHCPAYGKAVSGIAISLMKKILSNCFNSNVFPQHLNHPEYSAQAAPFYGLAVVPDDTPFAIHEFDVKPSGLMEHKWGLDTPLNADRSPAVRYCLIL